MSRKILLADDSLTIQKVVELTFAETDYEVIAVSSGDELLECLRDTEPDIVICDVIMPGRDGYDVCQEIKSSPETLHLPVILLTGTFEPFDRDRALAAGCSEIITKPFEARKLVETVEQLSTTAGAPPPANAEDEEGEAVFDGQVTPPPPIVVPETTSESEVESELEESDVHHEFGADTAEGVGQPDAEFFADEAPAFEETAKNIAVEFDPNAQNEEDSFALPDVEDPPDADAAGEGPTDDLRTVASDSWIEVPDPPSSGQFTRDEVPGEELEDPFSPEADEQQPQEAPEEPFAAESAIEEPVQTDDADADEPAGDEERSHTMTTPIDVASVMAEGRAEEEPPIDDAGDESVEDDPSDADTQDVTEQAEEAEEAIAAETAMESSENEEPSETVELDPQSDQFEAEEPEEPFEHEAPEESVAVEPPSDEPEVEEPAESFELDTPEESVAVEPPSDEPEVEEPAVSFELDTPEESVAVEPPSDEFETEAPEDSLEVETPEKPTEVEEPAEAAVTPPPAEPAAIDAGSLSDDDVDRIARRLLELAGDRIEHIAWEIIPDMAEMVVRERVRKLEADSEQ